MVFMKKAKITLKKSGKIGTEVASVAILRTQIGPENLEPRITFSSDIGLGSLSIAGGLALAMTGGSDVFDILRVGDAPEGGEIVKVRNLTSGLEQIFSGVRSISAAGGAGDDVLELSGSTLVSQITFNGGDGLDTIVGPASDSTWVIDGDGAGAINGNVHFVGIENAAGAANNEDEFSFAATGSLAGVVSGGDGGYDSLVVDGSFSHSVSSRATGPSSGSLQFDGRLLTYAGLEPITISGVSDIVIEGTSGSDLLLVEKDPGDATKLRVSSTNGSIESVSFSIAGLTSLRVDGKGGLDTITFGGSFTLGAASIDALAEGIFVNAGTVISTLGDVVFTALADEIAVTDVANVSTKAALIQIGGKISTTGNITLDAGVVRDVNVDSASLSLALATTSSANIAVLSGATLEAAALSLDAHTGGLVRAESPLSTRIEFTDTAVASLTDATITVTGLTVSAKTNTRYESVGRDAYNIVSGETKAYADDATIIAGAGGVSFVATDSTDLRAISPERALLIADVALPVDIAIGAARNSLSRTVEAYISNGSTVTVTGADVSLSAARESTAAAYVKATAVSASVPLPNTFSLSAAGTFTSNVLRGDVRAFIADSAVKTLVSGDISVDAEDVFAASAESETSMKSTLNPLAASSGAGTIGATLAYNSIGWLPSNALTGTLSQMPIGELLGDELGLGSVEERSKVHAFIARSTVEAKDDLFVTATSEAQINSYVENISETIAQALVSPIGGGASAVLAVNKVSSEAKAWIDQTGVAAPVVVGGDLTISAEDAAGIYATTILGNSATVVADGGQQIIEEEVNAVDATYSTDDGSNVILFGDTVEISETFLDEDFTTDDGAQMLATGDDILVAAGYADTRWTSEDGRRLLVAGDKIEVEAGYGNGGGDAESALVYQYIGANKRMDLGAVDYSDATKWALVSGDDDVVYRYLGAPGTVDLSLQDYSDDTKWQVRGADGDVKYQYLGTTATLDLGTQNYLDLEYWKPVADNVTFPEGLNFSASPVAAVGGVVVQNDVRSDVEAYVKNAVVSTANVTISAVESATIAAAIDSLVEAEGGNAFTGAGAVYAANGQIAANMILGSARAHITGSEVTAGDVSVTAKNTSSIETATAGALTSPGENLGVTLAFNSIGWKMAGFFSMTVDTFFGDDVTFATEQASATSASIDDSVVSATGDLEVTALNEATIQSDVSNSSSSDSVAVTGGGSKSLGLVASSNLVNTNTTATVGFTSASATNTVTVAGAFSVHAEDSASIFADAHLESISRSLNDGGITIISGVLERALTEYQYTPRSGVKNVAQGELVRTGEEIASDGEPRNIVYRFQGTDAEGVGRDLATENYASSPFWKKVELANAFSDLAVYGVSVSSPSEAMGVGGLSVRNDVRGLTSATISNAKASAGELAVTALETATIRALNESVVKALGGTFQVTSGSAVAVNFMNTSNLILSSAEAVIDGSDVTTMSGDVLVDAQNTATLSAEVKSETDSNGFSVGVTLAFNSIGWESQNILFNVSDALLGTSIGNQQPAFTRAAITDSSVESAGKISVTALSDASIDAEVLGSAKSVKAAVDGATTVAIGAVVALNRVSTLTEATIESSSSIEAQAGELKVASENTAEIFSNVSSLSTSLTGTGATGFALSVGASASRNDINSDTTARIDTVANATATGDITVSALDTSVINSGVEAVALGGSMSGGSGLAIAVGLALSRNTIENDVRALISDSANVESTGGRCPAERAQRLGNCGVFVGFFIQRSARRKHQHRGERRRRGGNEHHPRKHIRSSTRQCVEKLWRCLGDCQQYVGNRCVDSRGCCGWFRRIERRRRRARCFGCVQFYRLLARWNEVPD